MDFIQNDSNHVRLESLQATQDAGDRVLEEDSRTVALDGTVTILSQGFDSVEASFSFALPNFVENLTLTGSDDIDGSGNSEQNVLRGNDGANELVSTLLDDKYDNLVSGFGSVRFIEPVQEPSIILGR